MSLKQKWSDLMAKNETLASALLGVGVFLAFCLLAFVLVKVWQAAIPKAQADTVVKDGWLVDASAYLLLDRQIDAYSTFCRSGRNDDMTSNLGFDTTVFKHGIFEWHARLSHNSCAFSEDLPSYEALGTGIVIRFTR